MRHAAAPAFDTDAIPRGVPRSGAAPDATVAAPHATELALALAACDPMRMGLDVAVRRFVRAEREDGRELEPILATLAATLRAHVEPGLPPERRTALQHAVAWFAVSEFHRAD